MGAICRIAPPLAGIPDTERLVRLVHRDPRYRGTVYRPTRCPHLHHPDDQMNYGRIQGRASLKLDASAVFFALLYLDLLSETDNTEIFAHGDPYPMPARIDFYG